MKISAVIITKDEERMIEGCLKTLSWASEILVIDTGSIDKTNQIARKYKARIVKYGSGKNFSEWRNKGVSEAKGEWIFYVDADERIPKALQNEIEDILKNNKYTAYAVPRINYVLGKKLMHGGFYPDYQKRLFLKEKLRGWHGDVHEEPEFEEELGHLKNAMIHQKHETITEMVEKTNIWSEIEAKLMFDAKHPPMNIPRFCSAIAREFYYRMIKNKAFLDGKVGIIFALYQVFSKFVSYSKLWEMQNK